MWLHGFLDWPATYDAKTALISLGRAPVRRYLATRLEEAATGRVLDVGCGTGRHLADCPGFACGIDTQLAYLSKARQRSTASFAAMQAGELAFRDGTFRFVFCAGLCHHLPDAAVSRVVREMKRVAAPGGLVLVIDGVLLSWRNPLGRMLSHLDRGHHVRDLAVLTNILEAEGLSVACASLPGSYPAARTAFQYEKPV